ncbi:hypothetical protein E5676_scaffold108G001160 [Cucumis melo var. makuwa]|uniref:Uncharacterized protein n=1 Tax=Cucumis melo var. makuwa TaxID=1194695 RepID=A0A5A7THS6_CUCMM|nr:hypothetical protein E6C27_scaffold44G004110 [Cucumis melo var. makuwa]TYK05296.1 hypothetical protein E5676_scaffold108G001160 [Cucumis melo var. makuwa]
MENNETIQGDDNNDGGEGGRNNENDGGEVDRDENNQQDGNNETENEGQEGGQNDLIDDVVYNTAILNEVDKIEKKAIKMKKKKLEKRLAQRLVAVKTATITARGRDIAYQQAVRKSMRRGNLPSRILKSSFTTKFGSARPKKKKIQLNSQGFEAPSFKLLSQGR